MSESPELLVMPEVIHSSWHEFSFSPQGPDSFQAFSGGGTREPEPDSTQRSALKRLERSLCPATALLQIRPVKNN